MKSYNILSIDGGGVKGVIPAVWLVEMEKKIGPIHKHFDLFAGTSSGSLITCGLSVGKTAKEVLASFENDMPRAFPPLWKRLWHKLSNPIGPHYSASGVNIVLKEQFGEMTCENMLASTMVVSYDLTRGEPAVFCSEQHKNLLIRDICRASSAAPTYFPPHTIDGKTYIDGAMVANNPSAFCLPFYLKNRPSKEHRPFIVSLGTGSPNYDYEPEELENWSQLDWLSNITRIIFDGTSDAHDYILETNPKIEHYHRFQTPITMSSGKIEDTCKKNIENLKSEAYAYLASYEGERKMNSVITHLLEDNTA